MSWMTQVMRFSLAWNRFSSKAESCSASRSASTCSVDSSRIRQAIRNRLLMIQSPPIMKNLDQYVANSILFREYAACDDDAGVYQQEREKSLAIGTSGDCQKGREIGGELDGPDHVT